jgi:hypothetical protein
LHRGTRSNAFENRFVDDESDLDVLENGDADLYEQSCKQFDQDSVEVNVPVDEMAFEEECIIEGKFTAGEM